MNHRPLHEPRGSHGSFPHRHSHSSLRPSVVCPPSQIPTGLNGHTTPGGTVNLDRASGDPEYEVAIYQVIESRVVCWSRLPLGAGGYTSQQLQGLGLETHVLHSLAHSIRAGRVNPWSRTIQDRTDRRDELSTRLPEPVNHRPRRHLFGHRHATALRHGRHGPGRGSAARQVRSAHQTRASSTLIFNTVELSTGSDCSTCLMRTKTESFTVRLGLSRAAPALRDQLCSDLQPFQRLPSHGGADCFKALGTISRQSDVMSTAFRHSCPLPLELDGTSLCTCTQLLSNTSNLGGDGTIHKGAHSVSQLGAFHRRPLQLQYSCNPSSRTTSEEQTFNMLSIYSRGQFRRLGQVRTIRVGRFKRQT